MDSGSSSTSTGTPLDKTVFGAWSVRSRVGAQVSTPFYWSEIDEIHPDDLTMDIVLDRLASDGDPWADMYDNPNTIEPLLAMYQADLDAGLGDAPWPPVYPKMPHEPPRVHRRGRRPPMTTTEVPTDRLGANYYKLMAASTISNLGDGIGVIAYPWLASAVTRNPILIAGVAAAQRLPWLLFTLPAGVITDRNDRRRLMVGSNVARAFLTLGVGRR